MMDFRLSPEFIDQYRGREVPWGYKDGAGNSLGEITYMRSYSRKDPDTGVKEQWVDTCRRVIEGMFTIQKRHCRDLRIEWKNDKAQRTAKDAFDRLFNMKWLPSGRGLATMGTPLVMDDRNSGPLQSCAYISTRESVVEAMEFLFDASMLGVGVGFDASGAGKFQVSPPVGEPYLFVVPDSREGWVELMVRLLRAYIENEGQGTLPIPDYSLVRKKGAPIKRFGGEASGPEPLMHAFERVKFILDHRIGSFLTMADIVDIGNIIGKCVVVGGVRRSSEIFFIDADSADLNDFLNLKNYAVNPHRKEWGGLSNNSVRVQVGEDFSKYMNGITLNGEPGFFWMDIARSYGRLKDGPDWKDMRAEGANPCLTANTLLMTEEGWVSFGDAYERGNPNNIVVDGRVTYLPSPDGKEHPSNWKINNRIKYYPVTLPASEVFKTQENADIVKVSTSNGMEVRLTPDHLVATKRGMIPAGELIPNEDKVLITRGHLPEAPLGKPETIEEIDAVLMGLVAGDGYIAPGKDTELLYIDLWEEKRDILVDVIGWIQHIFDEYSEQYQSNSNRPFVAYHLETHPDRNKIRLSSSFLAAYLKDRYGFSKATKGIVPPIFLQKASSRPARFYVAALAFCDGTVNKYNKAGSSSIRINQSNKKMLQDVQLICLSNGIASSVYKRRDSAKRLMPDGHGGLAEYTTRDNYEIVFMANAYEYSTYIGFLQGPKVEKAERYITPSRKQAAFSTVVSVTEDGVEDVYCLREPNRRILCANGITMRRCGEQILESGETCVLVECYLNNCESRDDYIKTLKVAYLYGKTVTLLPTKWEKTNTIMQRNRRIGTSSSGVADFVDEHGFTELRSMWEDGYGYIQKTDKKYSEWLCIRESIRTTTVKPSGSTSLLAGSSPGVHWGLGGEFFIRRITLDKASPILAALLDVGYSYEDLENDPNSVVVLFPIHSKAKRSTTEVPAWEKVHLAAEAQANWSDNAVSCTVDFSPEEAGDIPKLLSMYSGKLKGISFMPQTPKDAYPHMPYEGITEEVYVEMCKPLRRADLTEAYRVGEEATGEKFCSSSVCEMKEEMESLVVPTVEVLMADVGLKI